MAEQDVKISALPAGVTLVGGELFAAVQDGVTVHITADQLPSHAVATVSKQANLVLYKLTSSSTSPALPSAAVTYDFDSGALSGVDNGWTLYLPAAGGSFRWTTSTQVVGTGATGVVVPSAWATPALISQDGSVGAPGAPGADGSPGSNGLNNAVVLVYLRSPTAPALPSATVTYTFATAQITGLTNGWTPTIPAGSDPVWATSASASSSGASDTIAAAEWATAVQVASNGTAGLNAATIFLFQRTATAVAPALPGSNVTYTFSTGSTTGITNGWSTTVPSSGGPILWTTTATALGTGATDIVAPSEWAAANTLAQDGLPGSNGAPGTPGSNGANAPLLSLSFTGIAFTFDAGGTPIPSSQTISATAVLQNVGGTATFTCTLYNSSGGAVSTPTMGGSGNTRTLSAAQFGAAAYAVISASLSGLSDTQTVIRVSNGADSFAFELTNDNQTLPADRNGHVTNYTGATSTLIVLRAGADDSGNWSFSKADSTGVTSAISANTVTDTFIADANDTGYIDITASRSGYSSVTKRFTLSKSKSAVATTGLNAQLGGISCVGQSTPHTVTAFAGIQFNADGQIYTKGGSSSATYSPNGQVWWLGAPGIAPTGTNTLMVKQLTSNRTTGTGTVAATGGLPATACSSSPVVNGSVGNAVYPQITWTYQITNSSGQIVQGYLYMDLESTD